MAIPENAQSQTDLHLEYVKKNLRQQNLGSFVVQEQEKAQKKSEIQDIEWLDAFHKQADVGYKILLTEIYKHSQEGSISLNDGLDPITLEDCFPKLDALEIMNDPAKLKEHLVNGGNLQQVYGFSNNVMLNLFCLSKNLLLEKKFTEAIKAFIFLCNLNPNITSFWIALGQAFEEVLNWNEALETYQIAISVDPTDFDSYFGLIRCCESIKDFSPAKEFLESLIEDESIKDQVKEFLDYVEAKENSLKNKAQVIGKNGAS